MNKYNMETPGYEALADVLVRAFKQASEGKGKERHAGEGVPFERQPMSTINIEQGSIDGFLYQARKKALEAKRLPDGRAQAELLGAINYLAGAVIALDTWAAGTLPGGENVAAKQTASIERDGLILWDGQNEHPPALALDVVVFVRLRNGWDSTGKVDQFLWKWVDVDKEDRQIVAYKVL